MSGIKGKSGRKKRNDGKKMKAVSFYMDMEQIDVNGIGHPKGAKYRWIPEEWFRHYKKVFGSNWQKVTRSIMMDHLSNYELMHMWDCNCNTRMEKWHKKNQESECIRCGYTPSQIQRFKNINAARIANTEKKTRLETPLTKCSCGAVLVIKDSEYGKVYQCPKCTRGGL